MTAAALGRAGGSGTLAAGGGAGAAGCAPLLEACGCPSPCRAVSDPDDDAPRIEGAIERAADGAIEEADETGGGGAA